MTLFVALKGLINHVSSGARANTLAIEQHVASIETALRDEIHAEVQGVEDRFSARLAALELILPGRSAQPASPVAQEPPP